MVTFRSLLILLKLHSYKFDFSSYLIYCFTIYKLILLECSMTQTSIHLLTLSLGMVKTGIKIYLRVKPTKNAKKLGVSCYQLFQIAGFVEHDC